MNRHTKPSRRAAFRRWAVMLNPAVARAVEAVRAELAPAVRCVALTGVREVVRVEGTLVRRGWWLDEYQIALAAGDAVKGTNVRTRVDWVSSRGSYWVVVLTRRAEVTS